MENNTDKTSLPTLGDTLWQILKRDYGFKPYSYEVPVDFYQSTREFWLPKFWLKWFPVVTKNKSSEDWMCARINGHKFEVVLVDIWYVQLWKNDVLLFDKRRFENDDLLKLIK